MTGALNRGGVAVKRPALKPPVKVEYSDADYRDMIEMLYVRFMERADPIEQKQKGHLFWDGAGNETLETIKSSSCYFELLKVIQKHDLMNPSFKGKELVEQVQQVLL